MNEKACGGGKRGWDSDSWWEERTLPEKVVLGIGFGILGIGALFLFGWVVMLLWNWLMPEIFGLKQVTYWQAWGLLVLSCILLKSWGSCGSPRNGDKKRKRHLRRYMRECQPDAEKALEEPGAPPATV